MSDFEEALRRAGYLANRDAATTAPLRFAPLMDFPPYAMTLHALRVVYETGREDGRRDALNAGDASAHKSA